MQDTKEIESEHLLFPIQHTDDRLHPKERVHGGIINGKARAYRFDNF